MRNWLLYFSITAMAGIASAQSMTEGAAMMGGSVAGVAAGKTISSGMSLLKKPSKQLEKAASTGVTGALVQPRPALEVGISVPRPEPAEPRLEPNNVPPPPARRPAPRRNASNHAEESPLQIFNAPIRQILPPPPPIDLALVSTGMEREKVLAMGAPSARISMYDDGHLTEIFQYRQTGASSGTVRLLDGVVSSVEARP